MIAHGTIGEETNDGYDGTMRIGEFGHGAMVQYNPNERERLK